MEADGQQLESESSLVEATGKGGTRKGDLKVLREGREQELTVTLEKMPDDRIE